MSPTTPEDVTGTGRLLGADGEGRQVRISHQGSIILSDGYCLDVVNCGRDFFAYHIDMKSKYVEMMGVGSAPDHASVMLCKSERTLYAADGDWPTEITISHLGHDWTVLAASGRYTLTVVGVRNHTDRQ